MLFDYIFKRFKRNKKRQEESLKDGLLPGSNLNVLCTKKGNKKIRPLKKTIIMPYDKNPGSLLDNPKYKNKKKKKSRKLIIKKKPAYRWISTKNISKLA